MTEPATMTVFVRDGMFRERAGIEGWQLADTALRTGDWASLDELVDDLRANGFAVHPVVFASGTFASPAAEILVGGAGGLTAFAAALRAWFHRHDGKKIHFEFNDHLIDLTGVSEKRLAELLRSLSNFDSPRGEDADAEGGDQD
jgi:hypothetical protein